MLLPYLNKELIEAGCDEAGRGCLAGAVYAAAVILPKDFENDLLNDSKQLTEKQRYALREVIEKEALAWAVGVVSPKEIDKINILNASFLAMHRAVDRLQLRPQHLLIDGTGYIGRFRGGQSYPYPPFRNRLSGGRLGIRILFALQHLHHRIQGSRTRYYRPAGQYQPRDTDFAGSSATGALVRQSGSYLCRRRYDNGYHTADNHPYCRTAVCRRFHLPRVCGGLQRAVSGHLVLFDIGDGR